MSFTGHSLGRSYDSYRESVSVFYSCPADCARKDKEILELCPRTKKSFGIWQCDNDTNGNLYSWNNPKSIGRKRGGSVNQWKDWDHHFWEKSQVSEELRIHDKTFWYSDSNERPPVNVGGKNLQRVKIIMIAIIMILEYGKEGETSSEKLDLFS